MRFFYLIMVILFLSLNLRPSITSVGPLLETIQTDLGMSSVTASLLTTLPVFCMGLFALFSIKLSNRLGNEKSIIISMILIFLATIARGFLQSSWLLIATALVAGIGIGIAGPLISGFIKKYFPNQLSVTSVYSVSMVIGAALATSFSIPLFHTFGSWQWSLSFWSIFGLIAILLMLGLVTKREKSNVVVMKLPSMRILNKRVYLFMLLFGFVCTIYYSITAWLAPFAQSMGMSASQSGLVLTLFTAIQIPVSFFLPMIVGRTGRRKMWLLLCGLSELIGILLLITYFVPWIAAIFLAFGAGGLFPLAILIPIEEANNADQATSWSAQMQFGGFMIGAMGPIVFGLALDIFNSFIPAFIIILVVLCAMAMVVLQLYKSSSEREASN